MKYPLPEGWSLKRGRDRPIRSIVLTSPRGWAATFSATDMNPGIVAYQFLDVLLSDNPAQPPQEKQQPYKCEDCGLEGEQKKSCWCGEDKSMQSQTERKPMTGSEIVKMHLGIVPSATSISEEVLRVVRAVEAFHGIKELAPAGSELPTNSADQAEVTSQGQIPAWHDAPTCAGLWVCDYFGEEISVTEFNDHEVKHFDRDEMSWCRWYGPIPEDKQ